VLVLAVLALGAPPAAVAEPWAETEHMLAMDDNVQLAATLYEPLTASYVSGKPDTTRIRVRFLRFDPHPHTFGKDRACARS
jgi:hypothetical protein